MVVKCLSIFPLEASLFPLTSMFLFLVWSFVQGDLDCLKGEEASRVSVARGRRSSQARRLSALKGHRDAPTTRPYGSTDRNERVTWFFRRLGGGITPLLAPEGVSTMMGYSLLVSRFLTREKVNCSREGLYLFMRSFTRPRYIIYMGT